MTDALLMAYSAGTLPEAFSLTVATHVSMCDECRARLGAFDSVGGALIEQGETARCRRQPAATMALIRAGGTSDGRPTTAPGAKGSGCPRRCGLYRRRA